MSPKALVWVIHVPYTPLKKVNSKPGYEEKTLFICSIENMSLNLMTEVLKFMNPMKSGNQI